MRPRGGPVRAVVLAVVVLVGLLGCARPSTRAAGPPPMGTNGAPAPALDWRACGGAFRCADVTVPLDYRQPAGETISLAAVRLPATDPAARLGTLAVNYGGPGTPATSSLRRLAQRFAGLHARFDLLA
ncbi:MAG TPA: alpha/beta hydrolase, partial [Actinomycetospora sp.]|nr:alpha/beta hydrolase [Actinomycetospora sp.]